MRSQEADAFDPLDLMNNAQQTCEVGTIGNILAIAVNDLTEKRDFLHALRGERTNLRNNVANGATALYAASERDDAECAGVRAAIDDWHMRADKLSAFVLGQDQVTIHISKAARRLICFNRADFALAEEWD